MSSIPRKKQGTSLKKILLLLLGLYLVMGFALYLFQERLIFLPTVLNQDYQYRFHHDFEEVFLNTGNDAVINGIHFKVEQPQGVILYFHGNAGNLSRWGNIAQYFTDYNYDVFVMDYRTYGKSTGTLNEEALYQDAQFCYNYLKKQYGESDIVLYGRSLGTGIATYMASKNNPKRLILETPYYSLADVAKKRFPIFPVKPLLSYTFPSYSFISGLKCPVLIVHGTEDRVVPMSSAEKLYKASNVKNTIFIKVKGASHHNLIDFPEYHQAIKSFLH
ncbi:alpha/beta hydrolase [Hanstruepera flava]|uniref:alpha/beta hydrolase n=1 Tax=Hanstruepera flava TaxID=2930218 RepID=UPI0020286257|nr:alpha/beta fold hydrolase [Hanstruepera flava]